MQYFLEFFGSILNVFAFLFSFWWVWLGPLSFGVFAMTLLNWRQSLYKQNIEWTFLELRFPRELDKSPRAMDQFFAAIHTLRNFPGDFMDKYWEGEVTLWISLEIVSLGGDIHFYMRIPTMHKRVIIANLYANYPTIDVEEVSDYMTRFPEGVAGIYQKGMKIWGGELILSKEDVYPIRTYMQFENIEEAMALDPISAILEIFTRVDRRENVMLQILIRPADPVWKERGDKIVQELKNKGLKKLAGPLGEYEDKPIRTPGETDLLKVLEENLKKPGYETLVRQMYIADEAVYNKEFGSRGIVSALNQYAAQHLNSFKRNFKASTDTKWTYFPHFFPERRLVVRKERLYYNFCLRQMPEETIVGRLFSLNILHFNLNKQTFILNTEELATLYHPPSKIVLTAPFLERVESKKMGPSAGLPIFEEDGNRDEK